MGLTYDVLVLDTNVYQHLRGGLSKANVTLARARKIVIPIIVEAELKYGFKYGQREQQNLQEWREFLSVSKAQIVSINSNTVDIYAFIMTRLRGNGTPIPTNDVWIASIALEQGAPLFTFDRHFEKVPGLRVITK